MDTKFPTLPLVGMVRQALADGAEPSTLCRLTGASSSAMNRWAESAKASPPSQAADPVAAPRRLEVVGADVGRNDRPVVVRLPSGVSIELSSPAALDRGLLTTLASLEACDVASR